MYGIVGNLERQKVKRLAKKALLEFSKRGEKAGLFDFSKSEYKGKKFKALIVVGGDGSLLRACRETRHSVPLVGVAAGKVSALMDVKPAGVKKAIEKISKGKYALEKRLRLDVAADRRKGIFALNEAMVVGKMSGELIRVRVKAGKKREEIAADGIIVATPTGSTGHAYSAGGKKLKQGLEMIAVVPSNPLMRKAKAFTISSSEKVEIRPLEKDKGYELVVDGRIRLKVKKRVLIKRGDDALFLKIRGLQ